MPISLALMSFSLLNLVLLISTSSSHPLTLPSKYIHHYLNIFSLKFLLGSLLAFCVTSPLQVSKIVILRTPASVECCCCSQLTKLPSCIIIAFSSNTAINSLFKNPLQNQFLECITNLLHNWTSSKQELRTEISDCLLPVSLYPYISFTVTFLEPCCFPHF